MAFSRIYKQSGREDGDDTQLANSRNNCHQKSVAITEELVGLAEEDITCYVKAGFPLEQQLKLLVSKLKLEPAKKLWAEININSG